MSLMAQRWKDLSGQISGNRRLQWALALAMVLLLAFTWQAINSARNQAQRSAINAEMDFRRVRSLQGQDIWLQRAEESGVTYKALLAELPETASPGLAQASLQNWLRETGTAATGRELRVDVQPAVMLSAPERTLRVTATLNGNVQARQAFNLLNQIESSNNLMVVESVMIRSDLNNIFNLTVNAYYRLPDGEAAP